MRIIEDFDFFTVTEKDDFSRLFHIPTARLEEAVQAVYDARKHIMTTPYAGCFDDVYIALTDIPITSEFASVDGDESTKSVFIHLNLLSIVHEYEQDGSVLIDIIFDERPTLYEFVRFLAFHEMGHIVHFELSIPGRMPLFDKMEEHFFKYLSSQRKFDRYFEDTLSPENNETIQRAYRKLPAERFADAFAFHQLGR